MVVQFDHQVPLKNNGITIKIALDVHHLDGNVRNNKKENLIPLCSKHHRYIHIKQYKDNIIKCIAEYIKQFN